MENQSTLIKDNGQTRKVLKTFLVLDCRYKKSLQVNMYHIFHGPNEFTAKEMLADLKSRLGNSDMLSLNTTELEGKNLTIAELTHHVHAMPFLISNRLVIVQNYLSQISGGAKKKNRAEVITDLAKLLDNLPDSTTLVFIENVTLRKNHSILKKGLKISDCVHAFPEPTKRELVPWIEKRVQQKEGKIDMPAAMALANVVGENLRMLDNELEKLILYVKNKRPIRLADVEYLCPYTVDSEAFAMANAIGRQNIEKALDQYHKHLNEGQHTLAILGSITSQFRSLLEIKSMAESGMTPPQIAQAKGWRSDYPVQIRLREGKKFSTKQLVDVFSILLETDKAIKTGQMEETMALDMLITRLCSMKKM